MTEELKSIDISKYEITETGQVLKMPEKEMKDEMEDEMKRAVEIIRELASIVRECVTCSYIVDDGALHRATLFLKEIKENDKRRNKTTK